MKPKSQLSKFWNTFKKITGLELPDLTTGIIWSLGLVLMIGLTVKYLCPIVTDYYDEEKNVEVKTTVRQVTNIEPPQLFICIPRMKSNLEELALGLSSGGKCKICKHLIDNSWDIWNQSFPIHQPIDHLIRSLQTGFIEKLISDPDSIETDYFDIGWKKPIISSILYYLTSIQETDLNFYASGRICMGQDHKNLQINITDNQLKILFSKLADYFCEYLDRIRNFTYRNRTFCIENLENGFIKDVSSFCFPFPNVEDFNVDELYFRQPLENNTINLHTENPIFNENGQRLLEVQIQSTNMMKFTITYSLQMKVLEQRESVSQASYKDKSKTDCFLRCKTEAILKECFCIPFTTRNFVTNSNLSFCRVEDYKKCANSTLESFEHCEQFECIRPLEHNFYQLKISPVYRKSYHNILYFECALRGVPKPYLEMVIREKEGPEDFIASVGGQFNFFLGMSGLTIIFFITLILDWIRRWRGLESEKLDAAAIGVKWRGLAKRSENKNEDDLKQKMDAMEREIEIFKSNADGYATVEDVDKLREELEMMEKVIRDFDMTNLNNEEETTC